MEFLVLHFSIDMMNKVGLVVVVMLYLKQFPPLEVFQIYQILIKNNKNRIRKLIRFFINSTYFL